MKVHGRYNVVSWRRAKTLAKRGKLPWFYRMRGGKEIACAGFSHNPDPLKPYYDNYLLQKRALSASGPLVATYQE